jgi:hypothetical protein
MTLIPPDESAARDAYSLQRRLLRRITDHIHQAHLAQGAQESPQGLALVVTTEASADERLNYVMPRRGTAWLPENHLIDAIAQLRQQHRSPVVWYADGLFPPAFGQTMLKQGLQNQQEWPTMIYQGRSVTPGSSLDGVQVRPLPAEQARQAWHEAQQNTALWQVWHNPLQPLSLEADFPAWDVAAWRGDRMVMLMRASRYERSLHLMARAIYASAQEQHDSLLLACAQALLSALYDPAQEAAADLAFAIAPSAAERRLWRELGFADGGSLIHFRSSAASASETA